MKAAMGVLGTIARRDSVSAVNTPLWPHLRHWTHTLCSVRTQTPYWQPSAEW